MRKDVAAVTTVLLNGLASTDPWWTNSFGATFAKPGLWPANVTSLPNRSLVTANLGMLGHLSSVQYSLGYHPFPSLIQFVR